MESLQQPLLASKINEMFLLSSTLPQSNSSKSPERPASAQHHNATRSPSPSNLPHSEPTTITVPSPSMATGDENALLAAQLASTVPVSDSEERPSLSYKDLIIEAIESSPERRLKLSEIYQVIKHLHVYYKKRSDQWGWQNSIRHNLSLHDCFVKLPLKQTSASGVVGHFWTVVRESEEKQSSSRRRSRNGTRLTRCSSGKVASSATKGKGRQSVSSDSGILSDESQAHSPTVILLDGTPVRKDTLTLGNGLSSVASAPQLHRPVPAYINDLQQQKEQPVSRPNLLATMTLNSLINTPVTTPSVPETLFGPYTDLASTLLTSSNLLSRVTNNSNPLSTPPNGAEGSLNEGLNLDQLQRLQLLNSSLYQNNNLLHQAFNHARLFEQQQQNQNLQSTGLLINQLLALKAQLAKPATNLFIPQTLPSVQPTANTNSLQQNLLHLLSQQLLNSNPAGQCPEFRRS
ncbi:Fork head domain protein [Aphelenchoides bicaudatus]|nr:Fork head domain protein [Aphelenchoides bicaudatus]